MADEKKYIIYSMRAKCDQGSMENYLTTVTGHGVVYQGNPLLNANDHVKQDNLTHFGDCKSMKKFDDARKQAAEKYKAEEGDGIFDALGKGIMYGLTDLAVGAKQALSFISNKCELDTPLPWQFTNDEHVIDGAPALTMESVCACRCGGIISIVLVAEETEELSDNEKTQEELLQEFISKLDQQVKDDFNWIMEIKNIGYYDTEKAIAVILENDSLIETFAERYNIPKSYIQTILFRELRCMDVRDDIGDGLVQLTYAFRLHDSFKQQVENWESLGPFHKATVPYPFVPHVTDSSTGFGQIFSKTAINAINHALSKGIINITDIGLPQGTTLSPDDENDIETIWKLLCEDQSFNLHISTLNLLACADEKTGRNNTDYHNLTADEIAAMFSRYNGTGDGAIEYGNDCYKWFLLFEEYNALGGTS